MTAQMSRLHTPFPLERMAEMSGWQFAGRVPNVICYTLDSPKYKERRDTDVSWNTIPLDNIRVR
jgi:hypothetical protein